MINFVNPGYLWALPLLAVPIVLHLMQRQVPKRLIFPSIRFIKKASDANQGHKRIRDFLTLLTRLLILTAAILFFAKPRIVESRLSDTAAGPGRVVFLLDTSASMSAGDLDRYVEETLADFAGDRSDWQFAAVISSNRVVKEVAWTKRAEVTKALETAEPEPVKGEHGPAVERIRELVGASRSTTCVVISDFQDSDWSIQQLEQLGSFCNLDLRVMPSKLVENCAIIAADHTLYDRKGVKVLTVSARVKNFSVSRRTATIRLEQDGQSSEGSLTLEGGGAQRINLEIPLGQSPVARLTMDSGDDYSLDDSLSHWTGPRAPAKVGLLMPSRQDALLEKFFLEKALVLQQKGGTPLLLKTEISASDYDGVGDELDVIFALDVIPSDLATLKNWVEKGGRLIYFSGSDALNVLGNMNIGGILKSRGISMHGDRARLESIYVDSFETSDPILEPFAKASADLNQFPIFKYLGLETHKSADSLIQLQNGMDLLIRERLGLGEVYIFGIGVLPLWSEFPTSRSFVPIVRQLAQEPVHEQRYRVESLAVGEVVPKRLLEKGALADLTTKEGVFMVGEEPVVVNVDRAESIPDSLDVTGIGSATAGEDERVRTQTAGLETVTDLTRLMAILILLGLLLEVIAANSQLFAKRR